MVREYIDNDGGYLIAKKRLADYKSANADPFPEYNGPEVSGEITQKLEERPWYLATVYTSYPLGLYEASEAAAEMTAFLLSQGVFVFCPIVHSHRPSKYMSNKIANDHDFWLTIDEKWLRICKGLIVTKMTNWESSRGITREIKFTANLNKPILYTNFLEMPKELL